MALDAIINIKEKVLLIYADSPSAGIYCKGNALLLLSLYLR